MVDEIISWKWYIDNDNTSLIIIEVKYWAKIGNLSGIISKRFPIPKCIFDELRSKKEKIICYLHDCEMRPYIMGKMVCDECVKEMEKSIKVTELTAENADLTQKLYFANKKISEYEGEDWDDLHDRPYSDERDE